MKECDILGGQNTHSPSTYFQRVKTHSPMIYAPAKTTRMLKHKPSNLSQRLSVDKSVTTAIEWRSTSRNISIPGRIIVPQLVAVS